MGKEEGYMCENKIPSFYLPYWKRRKKEVAGDNLQYYKPSFYWFTVFLSSSYSDHTLGFLSSLIKHLWFWINPC